MTGIVPVHFFLADADITLYPLDEDGLPQVDAPIWNGLSAQKLDMFARYIKVETTPSGSLVPKSHLTFLNHLIQIDQIWAVHQAVNPANPDPAEADFNAGRASYVMQIVWRREEDDRWFARIYYGVKCDAFELSSREVLEFDGKKSFTAERMVSKNGIGSVIC